MNRRWRAALVLIAASFVTGGWLVQRAMRPPAHSARLSASEGARLFESVMKRVQKNWVDSISVDEIYRRAAIGVVSELGDPSSSYLPPERLKRLREVVLFVVRPAEVAPGEVGQQVGDRSVEHDQQVELLSILEAHHRAYAEALSAMYGARGSSPKSSNSASSKV